jgi:hypothetical protein
MSPPPHYPLSLGRIAQLGTSIFRYAWRQMLLAAAIFLVPAYILMAVVSGAFSPRFNEWLAEAEHAATLGLPSPPPPSDFTAPAIALLAASIVLLIASFLSVAAIVRIVDTVYRGGRLGATAAVRDALGRMLSLIGGQLLYVAAALAVLLLGFSFAGVLLVGGGLLTFLGLVVLVGAFAALLFLAVRASMLTQAIVTDRLGAADGFARSWRVVAGSGWRVFGYVLLLALIGVLLDLVLGGIPTALLHLSDTTTGGVVAATAIDGLVGIFVAPVAPIVLTLLYFDLRWQHGEPAPLPGGGETPARPGAQRGGLPGQPGR